MLPLDSSTLKSLAVIGPNGDQPQCGDYAAGGSWGADKCGGGPINNNRTSSVLGGIKRVAPGLKVTYAPGVPIDDYDANATYFTTIQAHSFTTQSGEPGIIGRYSFMPQCDRPVARISDISRSCLVALPTPGHAAPSSSGGEASSSGLVR